MRHKSTLTGDMGKGLLRLNRNPEFAEYTSISAKVDTPSENKENLLLQPPQQNENVPEILNEEDEKIENENIKEKSEMSELGSEYSFMKSDLSSTSLLKEKPVVTKKEVREVLDQKKFIDNKILDKIQKNGFLNKRLLNNDNIFNILTNPIIKISKKKYYNNKRYYRNGVLKKRNIGKILYNDYVIKNSPFKNYFNEEGHNIFGRDLYSQNKSDIFLRRPYTSKHEYSSYNNIYAKKLTYIKHNNPNCKIRMKSSDVVRIGKPMKALIKWRDHSFSRIPTISKRVHAFDAKMFLYELNDNILSKEEKQIYECCPKKYDSVCYRKNLYKLQKEILNDYIKESTAIISQKYPNIGGWGNEPDNDSRRIKEDTVNFEENADESSEDEESRDLNMKNIYPKNMTLEEYLRLYEEMLENKLKKPNKNKLNNYVINYL